MTPALEALARRAVAAVPIKMWPDWTPVAFLKADGDTYLGVLTTSYHQPSRRTVTAPGSAGYYIDSGYIEDVIPLLDSPAGLGSLEDVVRESWGGEDIHVFVWWCEDYNPSGVATTCQDAGYVCQVQNTWAYGEVVWKPKRTSGTPADALVAALEAKP